MPGSARREVRGVAIDSLADCGGGAGRASEPRPGVAHRLEQAASLSATFENFERLSSVKVLCFGFYFESDTILLIVRKEFWAGEFQRFDCDAPFDSATESINGEESGWRSCLSARELWDEENRLQIGRRPNSLYKS